MRGLAAFAMAGRYQAVLTATAIAVIGLVFPPAGLISAAIVGLVALRQGHTAGVIVAGIGVAIVGLVGWGVFGIPVESIGYILVLWLPMLLVGAVLRSTRSLPFAVESALLVSGVVALWFMFQPEDPSGAWAQALKPLDHALQESRVVSDEDRLAVISELTRWKPGILAAGFFFQVLVSLFIARWWQSVLYNPGGFRGEFHELRLHRPLAYAALPAVLFMAFGPAGEWDVVRFLGLLLLMGFLIQGLAVAHRVVAKAKLHRVWLIALYLSFILIAPHAEVLVAAVGLADNWVDFRDRKRAA